MADQRGLRRVLLGFRRVVSHESTAKESLDCHGLVGIASLDFCGKYVLQQIATYEEAIRPGLSKVGSAKCMTLR